MHRKIFTCTEQNLHAFVHVKPLLFRAVHVVMYAEFDRLRCDQVHVIRFNQNFNNKNLPPVTKKYEASTMI